MEGKLVPTALLVCLVLGACSDQGSGGGCSLSTFESVRATWCVRVHECRASFPDSDKEFAARFGADWQACTMNRTSFIAAVQNAGTANGDAGPPADDDAFWSFLSNCENAVYLAACDVIADDALLATGQNCSAAVLTGEAACAANLFANDECGAWSPPTCPAP